MGKSGKRWCFTVNNFTDNEVELLKKTQAVKYMIVGIECGENGTPHLQGYVRFAKVQRFNAVKKIVGVRAHIEQARGSELQNDEYCRKDGVIAVELGQCNGSIGEKGCKAQTSDTIHKIIQQRVDGVTPVQIAAGPDAVCYFRYKKQIEQAVSDFIQNENVNELKATYTGTTWRLWQLKLIEEL